MITRKLFINFVSSEHLLTFIVSQRNDSPSVLFVLTSYVRNRSALQGSRSRLGCDLAADSEAERRREARPEERDSS